MNIGDQKPQATILEGFLYFFSMLVFSAVAQKNADHGSHLRSRLTVSSILLARLTSVEKGGAGQGREGG